MNYSWTPQVLVRKPVTLIDGSEVKPPSLVMRRRKSLFRFEYREPTPEEALAFRDAEAW